MWYDPESVFKAWDYFIKASDQLKDSQLFRYILSHAGGVGVSNKPPRAPGSDKTQGQGSFGPFTGGQNLTT